METESKLEALKTELQQKIGRNVLLFQQMEHMLKFLLANNGVEGKVSEIKQIKQRRAESLQTQSMGQLVGGLFKTTLALAATSSKEPTELDEAYVSFSFRVETDSEYVGAKKRALVSLVDDRNELIHRLLLRLDSKSPASYAEVIQSLDEQCERLKPEMEVLKKLVDSMQKARKEFVAFFDSEDGRNMLLLSDLRSSPLVLLLGELATKVARPDGWSPLSVAGQTLRQQAPDEMSQLKKKYGFRTVRELILATKIFDVTEEPSNKGGVRVLFRLKPGWELGSSSSTGCV